MSLSNIKRYADWESKNTRYVKFRTRGTQEFIFIIYFGDVLQ